jgi:hypothetical protein
MVVHPSGTDAETMPLLQAVLESRALARGGDPAGTPRPAEFHGVDATRGAVTSIVCCAGEVGSGTTEACMGRFFSKAVPLGRAMQVAPIKPTMKAKKCLELGA